MDLNETLFFVQVVKAGSFTQAATRLGMTKSKISRKVQDLEKRLGVTLLQRTTRSLSLTAAGQEFFARSARALDELQEAESRAAQAQTKISGLIRMTAAVDVGVGILGSLLKSFSDENPEVQVELVLTDTVVDLVRDGFDLALRMGDLEDSSLKARKIGNYRMGLFASPRYLRSRGTPKAPQELTQHLTMSFLTDEGHYPNITKSPRFAVDNFLLLYHLALESSGIAYLPMFMCTQDLRENRLVQVMKNWQPRGEGVHLVFPHREFQPKRVEVLIEYLVPRLRAYFEAR